MGRDQDSQQRLWLSLGYGGKRAPVATWRYWKKPNETREWVISAPNNLAKFVQKHTTVFYENKQIFKEETQWLATWAALAYFYKEIVPKLKPPPISGDYNKSSKERCQVLEDRIFNWSRKADLNVHKIIALVVRAHGGISRDELVKQVAKFTQARDPYGAVASLLTNRGNAYGRVFAVHDGIIRIHSDVEDLIRQLTWNVG